jgi:hypothetical protein
VDFSGLRAGAGQVMVVHFKPGNLSAYFIVMPPGSSGRKRGVARTGGSLKL